ncbi:MAG: ABC transporter substrate-binding protein [Proteobacteria bacterium]|nr:ABC transporter substrate-binding protein [Pseudomonadota bacterium]
MALESGDCHLAKASALVLLLVYVSLALAACDSKSGKSSQSPLEAVNVGRLICGGHLPLAVVEKKFQDQFKTFKLNTIQNHDWNDVISDMKSGKMAGTFILSPLAMNLIHEGFPGKIVLMADRNGNGFVLSNKFKSIDALKNQKSIIAVPHIFSQHHVLLHTVLKQHAVPKENVKVLGMPPRDMIHSLRNGEIDGFVVGEPEGYKSITLGVGWMAAISPQIWKDHMDHVFLVSDAFIKEHPEKLQELINQLVRGGEFIENNPHEAAIMGEDYTGSAAAVFEKVLTTPPNRISYANMVASKNDMMAMAKKLVEMKLWPNAPDNIASDYFDMRFTKKAEQTIRGN